MFAARTPELIRIADVAWAVSGSVSLELMMEALPTVILYKLNRFDLWIARPFIKAKYITLVNLLADEELMPEYLTERDVSDELSGWARTWLDDPVARARATANLAALRHHVARPGASQRPPAASSRGCASMPLARRPRLPCIAGHMNRLHARSNFVELPDLEGMSVFRSWRWFPPHATDARPDCGPSRAAARSPGSRATGRRRRAHGRDRDEPRS